MRPEACAYDVLCGVSKMNRFIHMPSTIYLSAYLQVCECAEALGSGVAELSCLLLSGANGVL